MIFIMRVATEIIYIKKELKREYYKRFFIIFNKNEKKSCGGVLPIIKLLVFLNTYI